MSKTLVRGWCTANNRESKRRKPKNMKRTNERVREEPTVFWRARESTLAAPANTLESFFIISEIILCDTYTQRGVRTAAAATTSTSGAGGVCEGFAALLDWRSPSSMLLMLALGPALYCCTLLLPLPNTANLQPALRTHAYQSCGDGLGPLKRRHMHMPFGIYA